MEKITDFLENVGIHIALIIAGVFGSVLSLGNKQKLSTFQKVTAIISGGAVANYLTPVLSEWIDLNDSSKYGFAFMLGFSGLESVKWILIKIKSKHIDKEE